MKYFIDVDNNCKGEVLVDNPVNPEGYLIIENNQTLDVDAFYYKYNPEDNTLVLNQEMLDTAANVVRTNRDIRLQNTDWSQGKDIPDSVSNKYKTYRQALRDISLQDGFPFSVIWPNLPE